MATVRDAADETPEAADGTRETADETREAADETREVAQESPEAAQESPEAAQESPEAAGRPPERAPDPRFTFANERTFLAWNRTALALVAGSLAASQLIDFDTEAGRLAASLTPLAMAIWLPLISYRRWGRNEAALRRGEPPPPSSLPRALTVGTAVLAALAAVLIVLGELK